MSELLTKSADLQGLHLMGLDGAKLATVREAFVDLAEGRIAFLIAEIGGLLGGSGKFHPVPWSRLRYDPIAKSFQIEMSKDTFKSAPSYDREQLASAGYGWSEQALRYFTPPASPPSPE